MVHALTAARRLLRPHGMLVDLRSDRFAHVRARHDQVYCLAGKRRFHAGPLKINRPLADFRAADRAIREVVRRGLFRHTASDFFEIRSYPAGPAELERYAITNPYATVDATTLRRLRNLLRRHPGARILVVTLSRLTVLEKA